MMDSKRIRLILNEVKKGEDVLDIGCVQHTTAKESSPNWLHKSLYQSSASVLGIDYLSDGVEKLKSMGYNVRCDDAETCTLNKSFDLIIAGELIEHLLNPGMFLQNMHKHLKPKGRLVISTPNPWFLPTIFQAIKGDVNVNEEHTCWFCPRTLQQILSRCGFRLKKLQHICDIKPTIRSAYLSYYLPTLHAIGFKQIASNDIVLVAEKEKK